MIKSAFRLSEPLNHSESIYVTESYQRPFLQLRRKANTNRDLACEVKILSIQSKLGLTRIIGDQVAEIVTKAMAILPTSLAIAGKSRLVSRDRGRKIGRSAKDWAKLNSQLLSPGMLTEIESEDSSAAERLVTKEAILRKPSLTELQAKNIPPAVAAFIVYAFRVLAVKPEPSAESRKAFVELIPRFFKQLQRCKLVTKCNVCSKSNLTRR